MRINPAGNSVPPQYQRLDSKAQSQQGRAAASPQASAASDSIQLDSVRDVSQVLAQSAEVRESVVEAVKLKMQAGEYLSKEAAADTARSILDL